MGTTPLCLFWEGFTVTHHEILDAQTWSPKTGFCRSVAAATTPVSWCTACIAGAPVNRVELDVPVRRLMMDEFALHKGQRYATVVACADTHQVVWIGEGRSREAIRPFFAWLGEAREQFEAVAMDMNSTFDLEVKDQCPNAEVVYDRFHVVAKYGREVMDRVRVDQANQLRDDKAARKIIKGSRWLLLRNANNLKPEQAVKLEELLAANASLTTAYLLKDQLKTLWFADDETTARNAWQEWHEMAISSGIEALDRFARKLAP